MDRSDRAIEVFLDYLRRNGTAWPRHPARDDVMREYGRIWSLVGYSRIEELAGLPLLDDPDVLDMLNVFGETVQCECGSRVYGPSGATAKLGIPRPTLDTTLKSLKINKNRIKGTNLSEDGQTRCVSFCTVSAN